MKKTLIYLIISLLIITLITGCTSIAADDTKGNTVPKENTVTVKEEIKSKEPRIETINIVSVGDIMMHMPQIKGGYVGGEKQYEFEYMFNPVRKYLENADVTIGNLETTLSGKEKGYSGYPAFNSPDQLAVDLKSVGFDILTTANNHSLDRRFYGVQRTLDTLDKIGLEHTGSSRTKQEQDAILIKEVKGIKIAVMAYTYSTNGIPFDKGKEFSVNLINKDKILRDINKAKENKIDLLVTSMHFGNEYQRQPSQSQKDLVDFLFKNGVDIVLGSHPHVLQPMETRKVITSDGKEKEGFVIYSMGNFISAQRDRYKDAGVILDINISKNFETNSTSINEVKYVPTWVDLSSVNGKSNFRVLPVRETINLYNKKLDKSLTSEDYSKLKRTLEDTTLHFKTSNYKIKENQK